MPKIIVISDPQLGEAAIMLEETVVPAHLEDDHSAAQLVERLGWAIVDAEQAEDAAPQRRRPLPRHYSRPITEWTRDTGNTLAA
jgi:hypothetical protein